MRDVVYADNRDFVRYADVRHSQGVKYGCGEVVCRQKESARLREPLHPVHKSRNSFNGLDGGLRVFVETAQVLYSLPEARASVAAPVRIRRVSDECVRCVASDGLQFVDRCRYRQTRILAGAVEYLPVAIVVAPHENDGRPAFGDGGNRLRAVYGVYDYPDGVPYSYLPDDVFFRGGIRYRKDLPAVFCGGRVDAADFFSQRLIRRIAEYDHNPVLHNCRFHRE